jgi:hypothetical protein
MTLLVAWSTQLAETPNAAYLASDSRITWGAPRHRWDAGRKLFACRTSADIFGYSGDVVFASQVLGQIVDLVDNGLLFNPGARLERRHSAVVAAIKASHLRRHQAPDQDFQIVHIGRRGSRMTSRFEAWVTSFRARGRSWADEPLVLEAGQPRTFGSGAAAFLDRLRMRPTPPKEDMDRAIFSAVCECVESEADRRSGGVPQLAGLYRVEPGRPIGVVIDGRRFLHGLPADVVHSGGLQWRDQGFRAVHGTILKAQRLVRRQDRSRSPGVPWR